MVGAFASSVAVGGACAIPPEIAFLERHGVARATLAHAARSAERCNMPADGVAIREGLVSEDAFYRALAAEAGLPFLAGPFAVHRSARFPECVTHGLVPLDTEGGEPDFAYAPTGAQVRKLLAARGRCRAGLAITTPTALRTEVMHTRAGAVADLAANGLPRVTPHLSYREGASLAQWCCGSATIAALTASYLWAPTLTTDVGALALGCAFLACTGPRLAAPLERTPAEVAPARRQDDRELPVYTVVVPLYRERRVLPRLLAALSALDYPRSKLDLKLLVEAGDWETLDALDRVVLPPHLEVIVAPPGEPRTKPRALNVALALARGEYVVVYDAEDVPDPAQLRLAVREFDRAEPDVVCLQARLAIDNTRDGLLTRFFTVEYAALFDVLNPALMRFDLPVTLGGTSNHLRTSVVRGLGGWDAYNVTEDADLGLRLAAAGYRVADLPSTTLEEAPRSLRAWMRQRTRWMKGFLQVAIVHSRRPVSGLRRLGLARFLGAGLVTVGTVLSAVVFPFFLALAAHSAATGQWLTVQRPTEIAAVGVGVAVFVAGLLALTLPPLAGIARRRWWSLLPIVPLMPLYFLLVSVAAWLGWLELLLDPDRWNKTEHGLAKTSRTGLV